MITEDEFRQMFPVDLAIRNGKPINPSKAFFEVTDTNKPGSRFCFDSAVCEYSIPFNR